MPPDIVLYNQKAGRKSAEGGESLVTLYKEERKMYQEYIRRKIVKETEKAYLVEQEVNNRRDGWHINVRWIAKKCCKERENDTVLVPEWLVSNGVW